MPEPQRYISAHELDRVRRLTAIRGRYTNCRHYAPTPTGMECGKHGARKNCTGCFTCPNCGGLMFTYKRHGTLSSLITGDGRRTKAYFINHAKSCAICGAYIEEELVSVSTHKEPEQKADCCQVDGCTNTAYEGHTYEIDGREFLICETHKNRIRTWKHHPHKGPENVPIRMCGSKLIDNPAYTRKKG